MKNKEDFYTYDSFSEIILFSMTTSEDAIDETSAYGDDDSSYNDDSVEESEEVWEPTLSASTSTERSL